MTKPGMFFAPFNQSILAASALSLVLAGCGGGGGGAAPQAGVSIGEPTGVGASPISKLVFPVRLSLPADGALTLSYETVDVNATGGTACSDAAAPDYVKVPAGLLVIPSGQSSGTIEITVCDASAFAGSAALKVNLTKVSANGYFPADALKTAYGLVSSPSVGKLNDSGVTLCSDWTSQSGCPKSGFAGQDGDTGRDTNSLSNTDADGRKGFAYTKLATNAGKAEALASSTAAWDCVQDNVTGLVWEAKTLANKTAVFNHAGATAYVGTVNTAALCGYADWRLPTPRELASLIDSSVAWSATSTATANQTYFADQQKAFYWSATSDVNSTATAWAADFRYGFLTLQTKTAADIGVRLVRGTMVAPAFQTPAADTVSDTTTGLIWRLCADGLSGSNCATGSAASYDWQGALTRVAALNQAGFAGHKDWRLPNRNELLSVVDYSKHNPAIDTAVFKGFPSVGGVAPSFWTSTPYAPDGVSAKAWFVGFLSGDLGISPLTETKYLLLVRGGQ